MADWAEPSDAYGSADGVPALLDRFEADPWGVWSELMDRLCPMLDTAFSASFAALPRLADIAAGREPAGRHWALFAAGPIVACSRRSAEGVAARDAYASQIAELLRPAAPAELEGLAGRLREQALADGQSVLAQRLPYPFGQAECADCGTVFSVADRVAVMG
ncbi:hypothetical protein ACFVOK_16600 [Streptomyces sp. NPDC057798]|uniref:hypothetical protein n=1 Tax=Streptomyces sp. NPDC057798 TaxID=3346252 RepID=UPI0036C69D75